MKDLCRSSTVALNYKFAHLKVCDEPGKSTKKLIDAHSAQIFSKEAKNALVLLLHLGIQTHQVLHLLLGLRQERLVAMVKDIAKATVYDYTGPVEGGTGL